MVLLKKYITYYSKKHKKCATDKSLLRNKNLNFLSIFY